MNEFKLVKQFLFPSPLCYKSALNPHPGHWKFPFNFQTHFGLFQQLLTPPLCLPLLMRFYRQPYSSTSPFCLGKQTKVLSQSLLMAKAPHSIHSVPPFSNTMAQHLQSDSNTSSQRETPLLMYSRAALAFFTPAAHSRRTAHLTSHRRTYCFQSQGAPTGRSQSPGLLLNAKPHMPRTR